MILPGDTHVSAQYREMMFVGREQGVDDLSGNL
jgi:hypothetical protein